MWLHEVKPDTEEADGLARHIMNSLAKAWAWDHNIKATAVVRKIGEGEAEWGNGQSGAQTLSCAKKAES